MTTEEDAKYYAHRKYLVLRVAEVIINEIKRLDVENKSEATITKIASMHQELEELREMDKKIDLICGCQVVDEEGE